ncbi:MAG TPA: S1 RNA-binding domain-containing protein [Vitreimonas sp.]|nr:S1 RNA-binding domain-containing protein [Vitreimonas sp.]
MVDAQDKKVTKKAADKTVKAEKADKAPTADKVAKADKADKVEKTEKTADSSKSLSKKPQTMADLLASTNYQIIVPKKGTNVVGAVTGKQKKTLLVDIGSKTEGVVTDKEYEMAADYIDQLKPGDKVEAIVLSSENDKGQVLLSLKQAAMDAKWQYFLDAMAKDEVLDAKGVEVNKGGLIVVVNGVRGFVPSSQFGKQFMGNINKLKGETLKVKAIEVDREKNRLIFSERHVSEAKELAQRAKALESVKSGESYWGTVSGVMHFGLFVTVEVPVEGSDSNGLVEGLVHISEISWEKVNNPKDYHKVGDRIQVKVLGVDDQTGKLNLSMKQLSNDPWQGISDRYPVGTTFEGTVTRVEPFGVFVNVEPGVDGLIHSSKLTPDTTFQKSDKVTVTVESVDADQRRMSLSLILTELPVGYK